VASKIVGLVYGFISKTASGFREGVAACFNGYPDINGEKCILRGDSNYGKDSGSLGQIPDPLGPNCMVGFRDSYKDRVKCMICKEGFVIDQKFGEGDCIKVTTEPEGCILSDG